MVAYKVLVLSFQYKLAVLAIVLATPLVVLASTTLCAAPPAALILTPVEIPVIPDPEPLKVVAVTTPVA